MEGLHPENAYPRWGYETLDGHRTELAQYVGCAKGEVTVREGALPLPPESPEQLADIVISAIGPKDAGGEL